MLWNRGTVPTVNGIKRGPFYTEISGLMV